MVNIKQQIMEQRLQIQRKVEYIRILWQLKLRWRFKEMQAVNREVKYMQVMNCYIRGNIPNEKLRKETLIHGLLNLILARTFSIEDFFTELFKFAEMCLKGEI